MSNEKDIWNLALEKAAQIAENLHDPFCGDIMTDVMAGAQIARAIRAAKFSEPASSTATPPCARPEKEREMGEMRRIEDIAKFLRSHSDQEMHDVASYIEWQRCLLTWCRARRPASGWRGRWKR